MNRTVFMQEFEAAELPDVLLQMAEWLTQHKPAVIYGLTFEPYQDIDGNGWSGYCFYGTSVNEVQEVLKQLAGEA